MPTHSLYLTTSRTAFVGGSVSSILGLDDNPVYSLISVPSAPLLSNILTADSQMLIVFTPNNPNESSIITDYQYSIDGGNTFLTMETPTSPYIIRNLINGVTYEVQIKALNSMGEGTASNLISAKPSKIPSAVIINSITTGNQSAIIFFTFTSDGGSEITNFKYSVDDGVTFTSFSPVQTTNPLTITGLSSSNTYDIVLKAVNFRGDGIASNSMKLPPIDYAMYFSFNTDAIDSISQTNFTPTGTLVINDTIQQVGTGCLDVTTNPIYGTGFNITQLSNANNTLTFSFWIQLNSSSESSTIAKHFWTIRTSSSSANSFALINGNNSGSPSFTNGLYFAGRSDNGSTIRVTNMLALPSSLSNYLNTWFHLVWIVNGTSWTPYINGVQQTSVDVGRYDGSSLGNQTQTTPYNVGYNINPTSLNNIGFGINPFNTAILGQCYLDDFRIYNRVLSETEISDIYNYR